MDTTINTNTPITDAAREIAEDVNTTAREVAVAYARDGGVVDSFPHWMWRPDGQSPDTHVVIRGRKGYPMGAREVQDLMDAVDYAEHKKLSVFGPNTYLSDLEYLRRTNQSM